MVYDPRKHHRRSIRLKQYDYSSAGAYYITICCYKRRHYFGKIVNGKMILSEFGVIVNTEWLRSSCIRKEIELDTYQIMPNHFHGIVFILETPDKSISQTDRNIAGANGRSPQMQPKSLSSLIAGFKSSATSRINQLRSTPGLPVFQRNYYERIIRNEKQLNTIREYIINNPLNWE